MEKIIIKGEKSSAKTVGVIAGAAVAVIVFIVCIAIFPMQYYWGTSLFGAVVSGLIVGFIIILWLGKMDLVVSDKRVYGCVAFGKRVDLPIDSVTAVGTSWLNGIDISTASGAIKFKLMKNNVAIHSAISKLIVDRQGKTNTIEQTVIKQEGTSGNTDELKKYKDLLDSGVITQEEFDAKKKQLLGL